MKIPFAPFWVLILAIYPLPVWNLLSRDLFDRVLRIAVDNNSSMANITLQIFGYRLSTMAEVTNSPNRCDRHVVFKFAQSGVKYRPLPKGNCRHCCPPTPRDVRLDLYTKEHQGIPVELTRENAAAFLGKNTKIVIFIHGFLEVTAVGNAYKIKKAYLTRETPYAVIVVDWSDLVSFPWYIDAVLNVRNTAKIVRKFLEDLHDDDVIDMRNVHVIGFSLGAHVAGFVGKYLREGLRLVRITGLDPAYPGFKNADSRYRLSKNDADFVDVIHTDGGGFGFINPIGHVDFYPNRGTFFQPGCDYDTLRRKDRVYDILSCSHTRAVNLYADSVESPYDFVAIKCSSGPDGRRSCDFKDVTFMGFAAAEKKTSGTYFLKTNHERPYARSDVDFVLGGM